MPHETHNYTQLPRRILNELSIPQADQKSSGRKATKPPSRKELRKEKRNERGSKQVSRAKPQTKKEEFRYKQRSRQDEGVNSQRSQKSRSVTKSKPTNIEPRHRPSKIHSEFSSIASPPPEISKGVAKKIAEEDETIQALEGVLGVKNPSKLPKAFQFDGLDTLLDGLDELDEPDRASLGKRKRSEEEAWLEKKRRDVKRQSKQHPRGDEVSAVRRDVDDSEEQLATDTGEPDSSEEIFSSESKNSDDDTVARTTAKPRRENPYVAPGTQSNRVPSAKYVPPSLRSNLMSTSEDSSQMSKRIKGLLNRLSESNLTNVAFEIDSLYQNQSRHLISTTIVQSLTDILSDPALLQDTFVILHSGLIAALFKIVGSDFGARAVETLYQNFMRLYSGTTSHDIDDLDNEKKRVINLIQVFGELYNFQVIASSLIFDIIRLLLTKLSELNTELLLKIVRSCGSQLRSDDPSALKEISLMLQEQIARAGKETISVRTKFMVETIEELKKGRAKHNVLASTVALEHRTAMKKRLGSLNQRNIKASEPLRIGLQDLQNADKTGRWWLVGSSFQDNNVKNDANEQPQLPKHHGNVEDIKSKDEDDGDDDDEIFFTNAPQDLAQLARDQRMNTDVRRSIFVAVMSATDCNDAFVRLKKLCLKKSQELEIPRVLIHCATVETSYNPFYTLVARRFCADHKLRMAFQFSLWDLFKRMDGEDGDEDAGVESEDGGGDKELSLRSLVSLGRMYGTLIAEEGLGLGVLKVSIQSSIFAGFVKIMARGRPTCSCHLLILRLYTTEHQLHPSPQLGQLRRQQNPNLSRNPPCLRDLAVLAAKERCCCFCR